MSSPSVRALEGHWAPYTLRPNMSPAVVFPTPGMQIFTAFYFFTMTTLLSFMIARRSLSLNPFSIASWRAYSIPRLTCLGVYVASICYVLQSGILLLGVGTARLNACHAAIMNNNTFYDLTKISLYMFLIEKVHIVGNTRLPRFKSKLYLVCLLSLVPFIISIIICLVERVWSVGEDGVCIIGLSKTGVLPVLVYGVFLDIFFTGLFVWPLLKSKLASPQLRAVATRTMLSSSVALVMTSINLIVLLAMGGIQPAWTSLLTVTADIMVNAIVLFYVTSSASRVHQTPHSADEGAVSTQSTYQPPSFANNRAPLRNSTGTRPAQAATVPALRSAYTVFPPPKVEEKEPEIDPQDGGGYVIPRDALTPTSSHGNSEPAFSQKPFSIEDREKQRAKGRSADAAASGPGLFSRLKKAFGSLGVVPASWTRESEEVVTRTNSIEVHVETAVETAEFPTRLQPAASGPDRARETSSHGRVAFVRPTQIGDAAVPTVHEARSTPTLNSQHSRDINLDDFDDIDDDSTKQSSAGGDQSQ